ncbi:MAG: hypothetical protein ACOVOR_00590 [Rhabdochlamydiaceae bacterium]
MANKLFQKNKTHVNIDTIDQVNHSKRSLTEAGKKLLTEKGEENYRDYASIHNKPEEKALCKEHNQTRSSSGISYFDSFSKRGRFFFKMAYAFYFRGTIKSIVFKVLGLSLFLVTSAQNIYAESKMYIPQEGLTLYQNKIYAKVHNDWYQVNTLHSDEKGVYVDAKDLPAGIWECYSCHKINLPWHFVCMRCGKAR